MFPTDYLSAKVTVDERALNQRVWDQFWANLPAERVLEILELGAGQGAMIERIMARGLLPRVNYTALDSETRHTSVLQQRAAEWQAASSWQIHPITISLEQWLEKDHGRQWDVLIAHAFLDLFHLPRLVPQLMEVLKPGGVLYATLNFNGHTAFEPPVDPGLDRQIIDLYHRSMDVVLPDGQRSGSRSGTQLLAEIPAAGVKIVAAGGSDWIVAPDNGSYPAEEAVFLRQILHFFEQSLTGHPDLDSASLAYWLHTRRRQIDQGQLIFTAHHLDILAIKPN